jgi:hypothetical protein
VEEIRSSAGHNSLLPLLDGMTRGFDQAAERLGASRHDLVVAGRNVAIRLAGEKLSHLLRPLSHLADIPGTQSTHQADAEFLVWECATTGIMPPPPPWVHEQLSYRGEVRGFEGGPISVNFNTEQCLVSLFDHSSRRGVFWIRDAAQLPYWEVSAPFRTLFHWWSQTFGGQIAHAAAVGRDGAGVLLVGRGGRGKSTTAAMCVETGMDYAGDDYVLVTRNPSPTAHSLYHTAKMHSRFQQSAIPEWNARVAGYVGPERKSLIYIHENMPNQVRRRLDLRAILMPRITTAREARIVRERQSSGVLAAAPSTLFQLPDARRKSLTFFAELARAIPTFTLHLGTDLMSAPRAISDWLSKEATTRAA